MIRHNEIEIDTKLRTISHMGESYEFSRRSAFEKICYFILGGGVSLQMAFSQFNDDDPDGGSIAGPRIFNVSLNQWQTRFLDRLQLEWRAFTIAGVSFYEIVSKHQTTNPQRYARTSQRGGQPIPWIRNKKGEQHAA